MWYTKFDLIKREGKIKCPNCSKIFSEQLFYSLDPMTCHDCSYKLVFLRTLNFIYIINLVESPELFKVIREYLINQSSKKGRFELKEVFRLFEGE